MKNKYERIEKAFNIIKERKNISVKELAVILNVSEMTVRRDVDALKEDGKVSTQYGAVFYLPPLRHELYAMETYHLDDAVIKHNTEKKQIGEYAASLVKSDDILIIDTGSTTEAFAASLPADIRLKVLCYNHNILNILLQKQDVELIFSGGYYHANTQMFESKEGINLIRNTRASKVFISAAGVHRTLGVTCANDYEVETKKAIFGSAEEKILLVDSSKFGVVKSAYFADIQDFDMVVTDSGIGNEWIDFFKEIEIPLHVV